MSEKTAEGARDKNADLSILEKLKSPNVVHIGMLRGDIAKPSLKQIVHIYGRDELIDYLAKGLLK